MTESTKRFSITPASMHILENCEVVKNMVVEYMKERPPLDRAKNNTTNCPICRSELSGIFGSFAWGIRHGEGHCIKCCFPLRVYHSVEDSCLKVSLQPGNPWPHKVHFQYYYPLVSESKWPRMRELWAQAEQDAKRFVELYNAEAEEGVA